MITFNNIVERFEIFAENHFFIKSFSFGSPDDVDLSKFEEFPLMHLVYTGATYDAGTKTYNLEVYILDVPHDKKGKVIPQKEAISDSEQCAEDIIADIRSGGNIFLFAQDYEVVNATTTPLEEETKNVLSGVLLDLSVQISYEWDACNAPIGGVVPGGDGCAPVSVTDGDGSLHNVASGGSYSCIPATSPVGFHYQRVIPWDQNDSGLASYVTAQRAAGAYDYTPPTNPATIAMLDNTYTGTDIGARLAENNRFGNTFRFTNDVGEQYTEGFAENVNNTSSNPRYCIDHLSRLAWYVQDAYNERVSRTPAEASTYVATFSYAGHSDWRLADAAEYLNAALYADFNNSYTGSYTPFVDDDMRQYGGQLWYGTFTKDNKYLQLRTNGRTFEERTATNTSEHLLMVRNHFD